MVHSAQIAHLFCIKINTISRRTQTSFHLSLVPRSIFECVQNDFWASFMIPHNKTPDSTLSVLDKRTIKVNFHIFRVWRTPAYLFCHRLYTFLSPLHRAGRVYGHGSMYNLLCRPQQHLPYCVPPTMKKRRHITFIFASCCNDRIFSSISFAEVDSKRSMRIYSMDKAIQHFFHHFTF
jgi:hypothetical protein